MRVAENWKDFSIIDTSDNEKLEKWGDIVLVRPDPQIIWKSEHKSPLWNTPHANIIVQIRAVVPGNIKRKSLKAG